MTRSELERGSPGMIRFEAETRWDVWGTVLSLLNFGDPTAWDFKSVRVVAMTPDGARWPLHFASDKAAGERLAAVHAEQCAAAPSPAEWADGKGFSDLADHLRRLAAASAQ